MNFKLTLKAEIISSNSSGSSKIKSHTFTGFVLLGCLFKVFSKEEKRHLTFPILLRNNADTSTPAQQSTTEDDQVILWVVYVGMS